MDKKIKDHFRQKDPVLFSYLNTVTLEKYSLPENLFANLCDAIISQQLSKKAGDTILGRFENLFPKKEITAEKLLDIPDKTLRSAGISFAKIIYLKDLAQKIQNNHIHFETLKKLGDEDVITKLVEVKGIGRWTAEMFLMFGLGRENVFSFGDLGLRRAIQKVYGFENEPDKTSVEKIIQSWEPYKTYACRILWQIHSLKK